jgi:hypothetical protein
MLKKDNEKTAKKWINGTKGLKFAKSVFFPDSRHDSKKKKNLEQLLVFGCFMVLKRGVENFKIDIFRGFYIQF